MRWYLKQETKIILKGLSALKEKKSSDKERTFCLFQSVLQPPPGPTVNCRFVPCLGTEQGQESPVECHMVQVTHLVRWGTTAQGPQLWAPELGNDAQESLSNRKTE